MDTRVSLKNTDHIDEPIKVNQFQNSCRVIGSAKCAPQRCISTLNGLILRYVDEGIAVNSEHEFDAILNHDISSPEVKPSLKHDPAVHALVHRAKYTLFGLLSVRREKKCQTKQLGHF